MKKFVFLLTSKGMLASYSVPRSIVKHTQDRKYSYKNEIDPSSHVVDSASFLLSEYHLSEYIAIKSNIFR